MADSWIILIPCARLLAPQEQTVLSAATAQGLYPQGERQGETNPHTRLGGQDRAEADVTGYFDASVRQEFQGNGAAL